MTITPRAASDLVDEISERIAARTAAAAERKQGRRAQRTEMAARRTVGLARRHAAKLARQQKPDGADNRPTEKPEIGDPSMGIVSTARPPKAGPSNPAPKPVMNPLHQCRYLGRNEVRCTGEVLDPDGEIALCRKHLARALAMIMRGMQSTGITKAPPAGSNS